MLPAFVLPDNTLSKNGESSAIYITEAHAGASGLLIFTLGLLEVIEQESLLLGIYGSANGESWDAQPAVEFPERFYTGVSAVLVDLAQHPEIRFIRAQWKVNRWGRGEKQPQFRVYLFAEQI